MSGPGHDEFEARIQRIAEKRGTTSSPTQEVAPGKVPSKPKRSVKPGSGNSRAIALIVLILVFVGGAFAFTQVGSRSKGTIQADAGGGSVLAAVQNLLTNNPLTTKKTEENAALTAVRTLTDQGWVIEGPGVATIDRAETALSDIALVSSAPSEVPAQSEIIPFDVSETCEVRQPKKDEVVHNVRLGHGTTKTDLHVFSNVEMADALIKHIKIVTNKHKPDLVGSMARHPMAAVDVIFTDTSGPVYLVLQAFNSDTIWNLQLADGVDLAHVAMIGENSGLAGLPDGATFEALRISDYVTSFEFGSNDEVVPCMVAPWRTPEPYWPAHQKAQNGNQLFENQLSSFNAGARAFGEWYSNALGRDPSENLVSVKATSHVLAGPIPETPVDLAPLAGRSIHITRNDRILRGDDALRQAHEELLAAAVGGDLALLNPEPMEVARK